MKKESITQEIIETPGIDTAGLRNVGAAIIRQMYQDVTADKLHGRKGAKLERERDRESAMKFFFEGGLEDTIDRYELDLRIKVIKDRVRGMVGVV